MSINSSKIHSKYASKKCVNKMTNIMTDGHPNSGHCCCIVASFVSDILAV